MELDDLPILTRTRQRLTRKFNSRISTDVEWAAEYTAPKGTLEIHFFAPRSLMDLELTTFEAPLTRPQSLAYEVDGAMQEVAFRVRESWREDTKVTSLQPAQIHETKRIVVTFTRPANELQMQVSIRVLGRLPPADLQLIVEAHGDMSAQRFHAAAEKLQEYVDTYSDRNPSVAYWLAASYRGYKALDRAEEASIPALVYGNFEVCVQMYQSIQDALPKQGILAVRTLQEQGRDWDVGGQHGLLALDKKQLFRLGYDGHYLKKNREILEVRRAAAARMLRDMQFVFSATTEALLYSSVRILHANGEVEDLSREHFRIIDHESNSIFVAMEDQKAGHWILPDLVAGDVIELEYHLLCRERLVDGRPLLFVLTPLFHEFFPTLRSSCQFNAPTDWPIRVATKNMAQTVTKQLVKGRDVYSLEGPCFLPAKRTGFAFENYYLNPLVACGNGTQSWKHFSAAALHANFGALKENVSSVDAIPTPLASLIAASDDSFEALEQVYYWVRDNLKYASFLSGKRLIGDSHRAEKIIEAGVGDCNDKSYLLHLVCRRLQIASEFVLISTTSGVIIEDLPGDQFDHVFLRFRRDDRWFYLDAANPSSVFASAPTWCQGLRCVVLNEAGERHTIELDEPCANRITIQETFSRRQDGWLQGSFDFKALGQNGRIVDERWQAMSLTVDDRVQAGQDCLRAFLPAAIVSDFETHSHTSHSSLFHVSGSHMRSPLSRFEGSRDDVGTLSWQFPMLPMQYWRTLQIDRLFAFELPMEINITVTLNEELFGVLADISHSSDLETDFCSIRQSVVRHAHSCSIHRDIEIKQRFVDSEEIGRVPEALEQLETAFQLVLALRHAPC